MTNAPKRNESPTQSPSTLRPGPLHLNLSESCESLSPDIQLQCTEATPLTAVSEVFDRSGNTFVKLLRPTSAESDDLQVDFDANHFFSSIPDEEYDSLQRKYGELIGEILIIEFPVEDLFEETISVSPSGVGGRASGSTPIPLRSLGISLCGNRDLNQMAVLICGLRPGGLAESDGRLAVGDQLLELNEHVLYGRSHLNAGPLVRSTLLSITNNSKTMMETVGKKLRSSGLRFVVHRSEENLTNMAVSPLTYLITSQKTSRKTSTETGQVSLSTPTHKLSIPNFGRSTYEEVHVTRLLRGRNGYGFAIMDKSFTNEPGIYVKQLVENSPASLDGTLRAGDRILRVDWHDALHASYDSVLEWIRSARHQVRIVVSRVRLLTADNQPSDDESSSASGLKLSFKKRLSAPILNSIFHAFTLHPASPSSTSSSLRVSKKSFMNIGLSCEEGSQQLHYSKNKHSERTSKTKGGRSSPKKLNLLSPDIVSLDLRRASCPDEFTPGFAKRLHSKHFLGVVPMSSFTQLVTSSNHQTSTSTSSTSFRRHTQNKISKIQRPHKSTDKATISSPTTSTRFIPLDRDPAEAALVRPILPGQETLIELRKDNACSLGVSLIGGAETSLGVVQVHEIFPEGVAALDGRLQPGDRILAVNGQPLTGLPFNTAVSKIATAFSGLTQIGSNADLSTLALTRNSTNQLQYRHQGNQLRSPNHSVPCGISLSVERLSGVQLKWYDQEVIVELAKKPGRGLGICLSQRTGLRNTNSTNNVPSILTPNGIHQTSTTQQQKSDSGEQAPLGVIVSDLIKGSIAHTDGRIMLGDQILSIDNIDVQNSEQEEVATLLKATQGKVTLTLGRLKNQPIPLNSVSAAFVFGH